jgi:hypothetical protein
MDQPTHNDRGHAKYAPSGSHRWLVCHGSVALSEGIPERRSSYAEEGTECHEAAGLVLSGASWDQATSELSEEQTDIVEEYTNFIFETLDNLNDKGLNPKMWVEQSVKSDHSNDWAGTADCGILAGRTLGIFDLKAGFMAVSPESEEFGINPQLGSYAVQFMDTHKLWDRVDKIRLTIVQPRVYDKPQTLTISTNTLELFKKVVLGHIAEIEKGDKTLVPGEHCGFCPAKGRCPELRKAAVEKAKMVFDCPKEPREYSDTEIAEILAEVDMIEAHIEGVRQYARRELEKGRKIPGWKLVEKRAAYRWTDWERVSKELIEILGFGYNEITKSKPMTPLQIKKVLKDHKMPQTIIDEYFVKESSGTTLAKEDDKRPHVTSNPFGD